MTTNIPEAFHYAEKIITLRQEQAELGGEIREFFRAAAEVGYPRAAMSGAIRFVLKLQKARENNQLDLFKTNEDRTEALKEEFVRKLGLD
jgi:uncharacterized protein (UPF0335 family)